jgi:uncharacterized protein (DUF433 family)
VTHETINYRDHITQDPASMVGKPVVKGTRIPVDVVLTRFAANPDVDALLQDYPELTRDDVRAVLAYAHEQAAGSSGFVSPQQFYRGAMQRADIRHILDALAT